MGRLGPFSENTIIVGDYLDIMAQIPDGCVDLVITDPAYEGSAHKWRKVGTTTRLGGHRDPNKRDETKWFPTIKNEDVADLVQELYRIMRRNTHAYIFADFEFLKTLHYFSIEEPVFDYFKPLIWDKMRLGMGYHYRCRYEFVVLLDKGKNRALKSLKMGDIFPVKPVLSSEKLVPTQKPEDLVEVFIWQHSLKGELIFDPFMGSGTTAVVADRLGRKFFGCDINPDYVEMALNRLEKDRAGRQLQLL